MTGPATTIDPVTADQAGVDGTPLRVTATPAALALIEELRIDHGPVMFHQSGGCCDGSSPMCYPVGEFLTGGSDVHLGQVAGADFWISRADKSQFQPQHRRHRRSGNPFHCRCRIRDRHGIDARVKPGHDE